MSRENIKKIKMGTISEQTFFPKKTYRWPVDHIYMRYT